MSPKLAFSSALSVLLMAGFALSDERGPALDLPLDTYRLIAPRVATPPLPRLPGLPALN